MKRFVPVCLIALGVASALNSAPAPARSLSEILRGARRPAKSPSPDPAASAPSLPAADSSLSAPDSTLPAAAPNLAAPTPIVSEPVASRRSEASPVPTSAPASPLEPNALDQHGVGRSAKELISFLEKGFAPERYARMPERPVEKCQLAIDAMARLADAKAQSAVPLLIRIAALRLPDGVSSLLQHDLAQTAPGSRPEFQTKAMRLLQFNAVNALGVIGDPSAREVVRTAYLQESSAAARIQYALNLACLGDTIGVDFLLQQIDLLNRRESAAAARVFTIITGEDFGYTENTALRARRTKARQYTDWWRKNRALFALAPAEVMERRLKPKTPVPYQPRNTRDLLKVATLYFDFHNSLGSRNARETLKAGGTALNSELERIASDPMEDLDIRIEALNWYYENNRSGAHGLLQKARRDENPEIADKAHTLLEQIERDRKLLGRP